jgi:stage II sporulation protein M
MRVGKGGTAKMTALKTRDTLPLYMFVSILFLMGIIVGIFMVNQLSLGQKQDLSAYFHHYFQTITQAPTTDTKALFTTIFFANAKWILVIGFLGLSVIGLPFIFITNFLKGGLIGFTIKYLIDRMAWKGVVLTFLAVVPQAILFVPAMIMISVSAITYGLYVMKVRRLTPTCWTLLKMACWMIGVALLASCFEAFVTPRIIVGIAPWLLAN